MSIPLRCATLAVAVLLPGLAGAASLSLATALDLAVQRSEAIRSARAGALSAGEAARAAAELPDPTLRVGVDNLPVTGPDRFNTTRDSMTVKRIGISQEWLSRDKREARQAAADATVGRETVLARVAAAEARLQTALAYLDAFYAAEALQLTTLIEHHAHEEVEAARARLASAAGGSQEVLMFAAASGAAEDDSAELRRQQNSARVVLERWVGRPADALDPVASFRAPSEDEFVAADPVVAVLQREIELARSGAAVAASNRRPNWTWEVGYGQRTGYSDMLTVGVSIPLQIAPAARQDRDVAAKLALVDKAEADLAEAMRAATADYRVLVGDVQRFEQRIERYRAAVLVPAGQRIAAATAAYRSNQAALSTLFDARHAEVEAQRKLLGLQRELAMRQARLAFRPIAAGELR